MIPWRWGCDGARDGDPTAQRVGAGGGSTSPTQIQLNGWVGTVIATKSDMSAGEMLLKNIGNNLCFPPSLSPFSPLLSHATKAWMGSVAYRCFSSTEHLLQGSFQGVGAKPNDPLQCTPGRGHAMSAGAQKSAFTTSHSAILKCTRLLMTKCYHQYRCYSKSPSNSH